MDPALPSVFVFPSPDFMLVELLRDEDILTYHFAKELERNRLDRSENAVKLIDAAGS